MHSTGRDRLTLIACALCVGGALGIFTLFPVWAPFWMAEFQATRGSVMLLFTASGVLMTLSLPVVGMLMARQPAWRIITAGAVLLGGGLLLAATMHAYLAFAFAYALAVGLGSALAGVLPFQGIAARLYPRHLGMVSGVLMIALAAIGFALPMLVTPFILAAGWRIALATTGAVFIVLVPLLSIGFLRETALPQAQTQAPASNDEPASAAASPGSPLKSLSFWLIWGGIFPLMLISTAFQANLTALLADRGIGIGRASYILSGMAVGSAIGAALIGWLVDRIDPRIVLAGAAGTIAAALLALTVANSFTFSAAATLAIGLASGGTLPMMSVLAFRRFGAAYAPALGLLNSTMLPYMLGPPLVGWVRDLSGSYTPALLAALPVLLLGTAGIWLLQGVSRPAQDDTP